MEESATGPYSIMKGGMDRYSYVHNSDLQRRGVDHSRGMIEEAIIKEFDVENQLRNNPNTPFRIADLGCSVGSNTLIAVNNIIQAINIKFKTQLEGTEVITQTDHTPEFQVYFNDHASNDFNTLFKSIPAQNGYFTAGVPGSFHTRLFPRCSLHIVHTSTAVHWLSTVPKDVVDAKSPAWNKGRIYYGNGSKVVDEAYLAQYVMDMEAFLLARAYEIVCGGLMFILVPAIPEETLASQTSPGLLMDVLGSCLMEMAKMEIFDEAKVDSFNVPIYLTSPKQVTELVERNGYFTVDRMERLESVFPPAVGAQILSSHIRAAFEELIKQHFGLGENDLEILFDLYTKRLVCPLSILTNSAEKSFQLFLVLKRNGVVAAT